MCAKLRMSMFGTEAAAQNSQKKVQETMATFGFTVGKVFTCSVLSSPEKFEMSCAQRRFRCVSRTSGPCLDAKRVGV